MVRRFFVSFLLMLLGIVVSMVLGGLVAHFAGPSLGLAVVIIGIVACAIAFPIWFNRPSKADQVLAATGVEADALITEVKDSRITINDVNYVVRLMLRVEPEGGQPFDSMAEATVSRVSIPPVGGRVRVKYDPANPGRAILAGNIRVGGGGVPSAPAAVQEADPGEVVEFMKGHGLDQAISSGQSLIYSTKMDPEAAGALLETADRQFLELGKTGIGAKAVVIEVHPLGVMVNGNNQGVTISMTVMPEDGEPYAAEATGIIGEKSWPYYQAGKMIWVKCDPNDKQRVSFWKSSAPEAV